MGHKGLVVQIIFMECSEHCRRTVFENGMTVVLSTIAIFLLENRGFDSFAASLTLCRENSLFFLFGGRGIFSKACHCRRQPYCEIQPVDAFHSPTMKKTIVVRLLDLLFHSNPPPQCPFLGPHSLDPFPPPILPWIPPM